MKKCPVCEKEYDEALDACPHCAKSEDNNHNKESTQKFKAICTNKRIILPAIIVLLLIIAAAVLFSANNARNISKARSFLSSGDYLAAWDIAESLDKKHSVALKADISNAMSEEIESWISCKNIEKAKESLQKYPMLDSDQTSDLRDQIYSACKHSFKTTEETYATCEKKGVKVEICKICDYEKKTESTQIPHRYNYTTTKEASCTEPGSRTATCLVCGKVITETINITEHSYARSTLKKATCTEDGERTLTCRTCGYSTTEIIPTITNHKYEFQTTQEATCTRNGEEREVCKLCGAVGTTRTLPMTGHSFSDATCTDAAQCIYCGETVGIATGHSWTDATVYSPKTCKNCGATEGSPLSEVTIHVRTALPFTFSNYVYNDVIEQTIQITSVTYDIGYVNRDGTYHINLKFSGEKTYDCNSNETNRYISIPYKIYDSDGYLVIGDNLTKSSVAVGDKFRDEKESIYHDFKPGTYYLDLLN